MKPKKKYDYYKLDVGFFPDIIKLCFDDKVFQQILKDHSITLKASALDTGIAETHLIGDGKDAIIILVFDMSLVDEDDLSDLVNTIAHEVSHAVDELAEHIGEDDNFVHETRAYLTGHLAGQIFKICMHEKEKHARKTSRKISKQKSEGSRGPELQVDQLDQRSAGPYSLSEPAMLAGRTQDTNRSTVTPTKSSLF